MIRNTQALAVKKARKFLAMAVMLLMLLAAAARGQSALDVFDPNANGGIRVVVVQPDGKILIAGDFATLSPNGGATVPRNRIARVNPDGTLDTAFRPDATCPQFSCSGNPTVYAIAVQADGKILAGGNFTSIGGQTRYNIARLDAITGLADSFNVGNYGVVSTIVVQPDAKILLGGYFTNIFRMNPDGTFNTVFDQNGSVYAIALQGDGKILAGGFFTSIGGGQPRNRIARLDPISGLADSFDPNANSSVYSIAVQADAKILAGGSFTSIGGQPRNYIARLDATTGLADSFDPNANGAVLSIAVQGDGKILVGGNFTSPGYHIARLNPDGSLDSDFNPNPSDSVYSIAVQSDGKILPAGNFSFIGGQYRGYIARLESDGRLDQTERFDDITSLTGSGWVQINNSQPGPGITNWFQGSSAVFASQSGAPNSYIAANYDNGTGLSTLSNWLLTPQITLQNGVVWTFYTRTVTAPVLADRLQVRMSTNGGSIDVGTTATSVGDFQTLLLDINPTYTLTGYPNDWTQFTVAVSGIPSPINGRLAFRYFVENGGPLGANSDYIDIDTVRYNCCGMNISGTISYCSNPVPGPVPNVTLTLTGDVAGSTLSDGSGNYQFLSLPSGGNYTLTPTKASRVPGSPNINTVDVVAVRQQFFRPYLTGCQLMAADVNGDGTVNTVDVIAVQRFFIGLSTGIANVGKYKFIPASRTYPGVVNNQTAQNYDTLVFGDVAVHFVE